MNNLNRSFSPNLFIVGFQKCGSSTLFDLLVQRPEIVGSTPKETYALTDEDYQHFSSINNISNPDFDWGTFFSNEKAVKYILEASVCNFYQKTALEYIAKLPKKKVIFILRDPIERFQSTFEYYGPLVKTSLGSIPTIDAFYNLVSSKREMIHVEGARYALEHGKYLQYIKEWEKIIGRQNIHIVNFKKMLKFPELVMNEISIFLDIEPCHNSVKLEHKNRTTLIKNKRLDYYVRRFFGGTGLGKTSLGDLYRILNGTRSKPPITKELRQKLEAIYSQEYKILSTYF
ncbi:MAG TPA: sulfotransferase domain-containing protein [Aequorivita sp.]|nr:sulfotransferase domain-containing protein [Aequorivita sp.]